MRTVDLLFFMGQSNMAGRGDAALAPVIAPGMGYEYRAVTDPDTLHPLEEPFGVNENDPAGVYGPGMKTGSMVSSFVNACTAQTSVPVVGVSCAKGGSAIAKWLPGTPYYQDAVRRARKARAFCRQTAIPSATAPWSGARAAPTATCTPPRTSTKPTPSASCTALCRMRARKPAF